LKTRRKNKSSERWLQHSRLASIGHRSTQKKEEEDGPQLPDLWQGQTQGYLYAAHMQYSTGTLHTEVSRWGKREQDKQDKGSAGNKPCGIICDKKLVSENKKFY